MKILFAVNDEKDAESITRMYQKEYKEIISSKTVYYYNAIIKELQKDKTYDRIVISEDLEMFSSDNYQAVDKFIFEKMDIISDEATNADGSDIPIILLCMDRRTKNDPLLVKLFGLGIYNVLIGQDRSVQKVVELIYKPRNKKEAKAYYKVETEKIDYSRNTSDNGVSESEIQSILNHYKRIGENPQKCVQSFDSIVSQYSQEQVKLIIETLPKNVKTILENNSSSYRKIMGIKGRKKGEDLLDNQKDYVEKEIEIGNKLTQPVIIPTAVAGKKISKNATDLKNKAIIEKRKEQERIAREKAEAEEKRKEQERIAREKAEAEEKRREQERIAREKAEAEAKKKEQERIAKEKAEAEEKKKEEKRRAKNMEKNEESVKQIEEIPVKRGRGRPRKNPIETSQPEDVPIKRKRGRPRKNPVDENNVIENVIKENKKDDNQNDVLIDFDDFEDVVSNSVNDNNNYSEKIDNTNYENLDEEDVLPEFEDYDDLIDEEDNEILPGFEDEDDNNEIDIEDDKYLDDYEDGQEDDEEQYEDNQDEYYDDFDDIYEEDDDILPGFDDDENSIETEVEKDSYEDDEYDEEDNIEEDEYDDEDDYDDEVENYDDEDFDDEYDYEDEYEDEENYEDEYDDEEENYEDEDFDEDEVDDYEDEVEENETLPGFDDNDDIMETDVQDDEILPSDEDEEEIIDKQHNGSFKGINNKNYQYDNNLASKIKDLKENEENTSYNIDTDNLITSNQKIISFVGTTKNGTSFIVNNLAELFSNKGIKTAILDLTKNKNSYYIYTNNDDELREKAHNCLEKLKDGVADGISVNKNLTVYTSLPSEDDVLDNVTSIIHSLLENYSIVLLDCDFETDVRYFKAAQEIYLVQSLDVLTIQPLTAFLRDLKVKNFLEPNKLRIVINKNIKMSLLNEKVLIGGMSVYNDPAMTYMTELFNRDTIKYTTIPFENQVYAKYLEGLVNCKITTKGYSKSFISSLNKLADMVYPTINGKKVNNNYSNQNAFSNNTNSILNKMKKKY